MNYSIFPKPLSQATKEKLTQEKKDKYWNAIKIHLKTALYFNPITPDCDHFISINYRDYDFLFKIYENYKIDIVDNSDDSEFVKNRLQEIQKIIKIYYPNIY